MIPSGVVAVELEQHLLRMHNVPEEKIVNLKESMNHEDLVNFLVRSHFILHSIDRYGEYDDGQLHFEESDSGGPAPDGNDPVD